MLNCPLNRLLKYLSLQTLQLRRPMLYLLALLKVPVLVLRDREVTLRLSPRLVAHRHHMGIRRLHNDTRWYRRLTGRHLRRLEARSELSMTEEETIHHRLTRRIRIDLRPTYAIHLRLLMPRLPVVLGIVSNIGGSRTRSKGRTRLVVVVEPRVNRTRVKRMMLDRRVGVVVGSMVLIVVPLNGVDGTSAIETAVILIVTGLVKRRGNL
jgi:hypothetical protein